MRYHLELAGAIALAIVVFAARETPAQPRICVRAEIEEPFAFPDGTRHPSGLLRICLDRDYSPVAALHSVMAGGETTARFFSRRTKPEVEEAASPRLAFVRDGAGILVLRGYTLSRDGAVEAYWLQPPRGKRVAPGALVASAPAPAPGSGTVWLAAAETH